MATVWIVAAGLTLLSLLLHFVAPSTLRESEAGWAERVTYHQTKPSFAVRPLNTSAVVLLHEATGWGYRTSFFALQYTLLLLCGPALAGWLRRQGFSLREGLLGMTLFYLSLPVLLAHFAPIFTWGDIWVYLLLPLAFSAAVAGRILLSAIWLAAAILARETSAIFLLPWLALIYMRTRYTAWSLAAVALAVMGTAALARTFWTGAGLGPGDWEWDQRAHLLTFNFASLVRSRDTIFSLVAGLGVLWPIGLYQMFRSSQFDSPRYYDVLRFGATVTILGFTVPTLLFMQARESRLFFPPFLFLIPLALVFLRQHHEALTAFWRERPRWVLVAGPPLICLVGIGLALAAFPDFEYRKWRDGNWVIFGLHLGATLVFVLVLWRNRRDSGGRATLTGLGRIQARLSAPRSTQRSGRRGSP